MTTAQQIRVSQIEAELKSFERATANARNAAERNEAQHRADQLRAELARAVEGKLTANMRDR